MALTALHALNGFRDSDEGASLEEAIQARHANGNAFMQAMGPAPLAASHNHISRFNR